MEIVSIYDSLQAKLENIHIYSGYFSSLCPFHDDSSPSFFVYEESEKKSMEYQCRACGAHGSLAYLDRYLGTHIRRGLTQSQLKPVVLPRWKQWERDYGNLEGIVQYAHENLLRHTNYRKWFERRQIDEFIEQGRLGYISGWAIFPVFHSDLRIADIAVRAVSGKGDIRYSVSALVDHSSLRPLYIPNWERVNLSKTIYVVYGIVDAIALELAGLPAVTGITGKSLSADLLKPLNKRYIIVPDDGEEREAHQLANKLGWRARVQRIKYPENTKDADDIRIKFGNQYLLNALGA